jgi:hypothetical protein
MRTPMRNPKALVAAGALVLAACGGGGGDGGGGGGSPTDASTASFCRTFTELGSQVTPREAADRLDEVGTPSGIASGARHGFEVLVDHLRRLPDDAKDADLTAMAQDLKSSDRADVESFLSYYATQCGLVPTGGSS